MQRWKFEAKLSVHVQVMSSEEETALVTACKDGDMAAAFHLVKYVNINCMVDSRTPLITAIHYHQHPMVEMILRLDEININRAVAGWTALHEACFINNVEAIQAVLRCGKEVHKNMVDKDGYTPIMIAIWFNRVEAVIELLAINEVDLDVDGQEIEDLAG